MIILALDTTSTVGSLAIRRNGGVAAEMRFEAKDGLAQILFPAIDELLTKAGITLDQIDAFASATGPGSFTGVRVGLSAVKGLAHALAKPAVGISNLRALATYGTSPRRAVLLDARRGDVFAALYDQHLNCISPEVVTRLPTWLEDDALAPAEFIAPLELRAQLPQEIAYVAAPQDMAAAIAICAQVDIAGSALMSLAGLDANYVRRSDAELFWHDAR